jgi:hypothetical protein
VRRRFIGLLAAGLLLVAGFTAAAVASGGSPFGLLEDQPTTTGEPTSVKSTTDESTEDVTTEDANTDEETTDEETTTEATTTRAEHKVTICHHTGSKKHPFHPITVDEHALAAHTGHGDTVGPCPTATASTAPGAKHKQKHPSRNKRGASRSQRSEHGASKGKSHRPGNQGGDRHTGNHAGGK